MKEKANTLRAHLRSGVNLRLELIKEALNQHVSADGAYFIDVEYRIV